MEVKEDRVLLMVSDAARYMSKAAREILMPLFPNMIHVTCLAHGLHRIAEEVRSNFEEIDGLISNIKKVYFFIK